jgi:DNA-directed RNA polymerase specialized sigma24 family protein
MPPASVDPGTPKATSFGERRWADLGIITPQDPALEKAHADRPIPLTPSRTARPLKPSQVDALIAGYQSGRTMKELAAEFGVNRLTVSGHLHRAKVTVRRGRLASEDVREAARLYEEGWSSGQLAEKFGVSADSVLKVLRRAGVAIRPRRGGPRPKAGTGQEAC